MKRMSAPPSGINVAMVWRNSAPGLQRSSAHRRNRGRSPRPVLCRSTTAPLTPSHQERRDKSERKSQRRLGNQRAFHIVEQDKSSVRYTGDVERIRILETRVTRESEPKIQIAWVDGDLRRWIQEGRVCCR